MVAPLSSRAEARLARAWVSAASLGTRDGSRADRPTLL